DKSIGLYINTLPLVVDHDIDKSVLDVLLKIQDDINEMNFCSNINLSKLQGSSNRLFDVLFVHKNYPGSVSRRKESELNFKLIKSIEKIDYPLALLVYESSYQNNLELELYYAGELFSLDRIGEFLELIKYFIAEIPNSYEKSVKQLNSFKQLESNLLNKGSLLHFDNSYTLNAIFEEQSNKFPDRIALDCAGRKLSYSELNVLSNQLAHYLRNHCEVQTEELVGLRPPMSG
ncbi:MAG: amino acid adenylation protein, partial [Rickettsiaceae bacterium]|nr:amino acid adenylation protein [Rickettsiaceae bacterium]